MEINAEFDQRIVVHSHAEPWLSSPMAGVERRPLDRVGGEVARATSIVRYAPGSHFSPHIHTGGEEFLVLDGVFQDEHGDFPAGSYIRNPPGSSHTPGSEDGCTIFVKLWQFVPDDNDHVMVRADQETALPYGDSDDVTVIQLHKDERETVSLFELAAQGQLSLDASNGLEMLVLAGEVTESSDHLNQGSWLRLPTGSKANFSAGTEGARIWIKQGNLDLVQEQIDRVTAAQ